MINAAEPPELPPIVARPSGSLVSFTLAFFLDQRQNLGFDELRIPRRHRVVLQPALAALRVAAAVANRDRHHRRDALLRDQIVEGGEQQLVRSVRADDERRGAAGDVLLRHVDSQAARVGSRMTGGHDELGRIVGIDGAERASFPRNAGIDLAVRRAHRQVVDRSRRNTILHRHLRRRRVCGTEDEVPVDVDWRQRAVWQILRPDEPCRIRIAGGRGRSWCRCRLRLRSCRARSGRRIQRNHEAGRGHQAEKGRNLQS